MLARTVAEAAARGVRSVAVTFDRHPREILTPGSEPRLLTTVERKARLIELAGIDVLVVLAFTAEFSRIEAAEFVRTGPRRRGARGARGDGRELHVRAPRRGDDRDPLGPGAPFGLTAEGVDLVELDGRVVSSSSIREALAAGDLAWPTEACGRRFVLDGEVETGHGRGRGLGFPTANLRTWPRLLLPGQGIYAGVGELDGHRYLAAIDVGTNPTFGVEPLHVEAFLMDYAGGDLVGRPLSIEFWARLRDEERYPSAEALTAAIELDVEHTRAVVPDSERS